MSAFRCGKESGGGASGGASGGRTMSEVVLRRVPASHYDRTLVANLAVPFGPLLDVQLGPGHGVAKVVFKHKHDAEEAAFNLHLSEVDGAVIFADKKKEEGTDGERADLR